jgi:hypothetical protein
MKTTYLYIPDSFEKLCAPEISEQYDNHTVCLSKPPFGGRKLPPSFRWVETVDGNFIGMVRKVCLFPTGRKVKTPVMA